MGQIMGTYNTRDIGLNMNEKSTFDRNIGFGFNRRERQMLVCEDHLISARIPPQFRDYCAHLLLDYQVCRHKHMPLLYRCAHEKHVYLNCEHEDYILRMKEFERERRLREREIRLKKPPQIPPSGKPKPKEKDC